MPALFSRKIGRPASLKVDPPRTANPSTRRGRTAIERAEMRQRLVAGWDAADEMAEQRLPTAGRWLPGYGFMVWIIRERFERGVGRVEVRVAAANAEGQAFWRSLGFGDHVHVLHRKLG